LAAAFSDAAGFLICAFSLPEDTLVDGYVTLTVTLRLYALHPGFVPWIRQTCRRKQTQNHHHDRKNWVYRRQTPPVSQPTAGRFASRGPFPKFPAL